MLHLQFETVVGLGLLKHPESHSLSLPPVLLMHQQWRISLHARARGFRLRLRASKVLSGWGDSEEAWFSIVVRVRSSLLRLRLGTSGASTVLTRSTLGSRVLRLIKGVPRRRPWPRRRLDGDAVTAEERTESRSPPGSGRFHRLALWPREKKGVAFLSREPTKGLLGSLAFLSYSASRRNHGGVIIHAAVSFFYLILLSKVSLARRAGSPVALATLVTSLGVFSWSYLHFMTQISEAAWMVCFNILAVTSLLSLSQHQIVLSKIMLLIGRNAGFSWIFIMGFLFLSCEIHPERSLEVIKMITDGSATWIPHLILIYHTFSHVLEEKPRDHKKLAILISLLYFLVMEILLICGFELKLHKVERIPCFHKKAMKELRSYLHS